MNFICAEDAERAENGRNGQAQFHYPEHHGGGNRGTSTFGSRLAESANEAGLAGARRRGGYKVEQQKPLPMVYKDVKLDCGYRLDLVVAMRSVEVKTIDRIAPLHDARLPSYLRVSGESVGLIINFAVRLPKNGLNRMVNECPDAAGSAVSKKAENSSNP